MNDDLPADEITALGSIALSGPNGLLGTCVKVGTSAGDLREASASASG